MTILSKLSSQIGEKTEEANRLIAIEFIQNPVLLEEVKDGLSSKDKALVGDCTEIFTKVAEQHPELVVPYTENLISLLTSNTTRIRWEAIHSIALITPFVPEVISTLLPKLMELINTDKSTIVRDYSIQTLCNYADLGKLEAHAVYPILKDSLLLWEGKHRARILTGLLNICRHAPDCALEIRGIAEEYVDDHRSGVKKAAKTIVKRIDKGLI